MTSTVNAIIDIHDSPVALQTLPVSSTETGAAAVVHIEYRNTTAGPILNGQTQGGTGGGGWPTMNLN